MSAELAAHAQAVRDSIARDGWHQGDYWGEGRSACLAGHILRAHFAHGVDAGAVKNLMAQELIERGIEAEFSAEYQAWTLLDGKTSLIPYFNDFVLKSQTEALEFMDKIIIKAHEKA